MSTKNNHKVQEMLKIYSSPLNFSSGAISVILAAGHGKRIKSEIPKVLHRIWGISSVERVCRAATKGIACPDRIVVVGIKALEVMEALGKRRGMSFAYQAAQKGTGHALQVAVEPIKNKKFNGNVYVFPGDASLLDDRTIRNFRKRFEKSDFDMFFLTGNHEGEYRTNYYGRVLRIPRFDANGKKSPNGDYNSVIGIMEAKDIQKLDSKKGYKIRYGGRTYSFSKKELLNNPEFNSGIFAFKAEKLESNLKRLKPDNVQKEIYITDLVAIFRKTGLKVGAYNIKNNQSILAFNNKSVLKKMEVLARKSYYELLKDIITIEDEEKFYIADEVVRDILKMSKQNTSLDIFIGSGSWIGRGVKLNRCVEIGRAAALAGNIILGKGVKIGEGVHLGAYPGQVLKIGTNSEIFKGNIIKGNTWLGEDVKVESGVRITGSDEFPTRIGDRCLIKGTSYIFGSIIERRSWIEHSILIKQRIYRIEKKGGGVQKIMYILPLPEGIDSLTPIE